MLASLDHRALQQGVYGFVPIDKWLIDDVRFHGVHVVGQYALGPYEVYLAQEGVGIEYRLYMRSDGVSQMQKYLNDDALLLSLQQAYPVVGLDDGLRLDKDSLAGGRLIVDDTLNLALVTRRSGDNHAPVAECGRCILRGKSVLLRLVQDASERSTNGLACGSQRETYPLKFGRGVVAHLAKLVEHSVYAVYDMRKGQNLLGQRVEGRVAGRDGGVTVLRVAFLSLVGCQKTDNLRDSCQALLERKEFAFVQIAPLELYTDEGASHVQKILVGKSVFFLHNMAKLSHLLQLLADRLQMGRGRDAVHHI